MEQKVKYYDTSATKIALDIDDELKAGWLVKTMVSVQRLGADQVIIIYERKKRKAVKE